MPETIAQHIAKGMSVGRVSWNKYSSAIVWELRQSGTRSQRCKCCWLASTRFFRVGANFHNCMSPIRSVYWLQMKWSFDWVRWIAGHISPHRTNQWNPKTNIYAFSRLKRHLWKRNSPKICMPKSSSKETNAWLYHMDHSMTPSE